MQAKPSRIPLRLLPAACLGTLGLLSACSPAQVREERYADGARKSQSSSVRLPGDATLRHGLQVTWYPDGGRESMESYLHGYRQGYSLRWYPDGRLKSAEHFTDGIMDGQGKYWDASGALVACVAGAAGGCPDPDAASGKAHPSRLVSRP